MPSRRGRSGFAKNIQLIVMLFLAVSSAAQAYTPEDPIAPYVGDWTALGWGSEVRFKQSRKEFVRQLSGRLQINPEAGEETIMSLTVKHTTEFAFTVLPDGAVRGRGVITYALFPNLCGVAALAEQVNKAVNFMDKIPFLLQLSTELGKGVVGALHADWSAKETKLANTLVGWRLDSPEGLASRFSTGEKAAMPVLHIAAWVRENEADEIVNLAKTIMRNRCNQLACISGMTLDPRLLKNKCTPGGFTFLNGFSCGLLASAPSRRRWRTWPSCFFPRRWTPSGSSPAIKWSRK